MFLLFFFFFLFFFFGLFFFFFCFVLFFVCLFFFVCFFLGGWGGVSGKDIFWYLPRYSLNFTTLLANSADDKLMLFFLCFSENRIWHFMQIVSNGDNLHRLSNPVFWEK